VTDHMPGLTSLQPDSLLPANHTAGLAPR
jgi:hypothetical protein